jgi:hypothetical protein
MAFIQKHKKFLSAAAAFLVIISGLFMLFLPRLVNLEMLKDHFVIIASKAVDGKVDYRSVELSLWPLPHFVIHQPRISIPTTLNGRAFSLSLYPALLPLLKGELRPRAIVIESPQIGCFLKEKNVTSGFHSEDLTFNTIEKVLWNTMEPYVSKIPPLRFQLNDGQISLMGNEKQLFDFSRLNFSAVMDPKDFQVDFECTSNLFETFKGHLSVDVIALTLQADLHLHHFHPAALFQYCFPDGWDGWTVDHHSDLNLKIDLKQNDQKICKARIHSLDSKLILSREKTSQVFDVAVFNGFLKSCDKTFTLECQEFRVKHPAGTLHGRYQHIPELKNPHVIEINGKDINTAAMRESILAFVKDNATIRLIFSILRGGEVSSLSFQSQAKSFIQLWHPDFFHLWGEIYNGEIYIPRARLYLKKVQGKVDIVHCVLHAKNISAIQGNSRGYEGELTLGLMKRDAPFHFTLDLDADLSDLPPILKRVVPIKAFQHELNMVDQVQGRARIHLTLGDRLFKIRPQIKVNQFELSVRYQRLPFSLYATGAHFFLDSQRIAASNVGVRMGASRVQNLSWCLQLASPHPLHFETGPYSLVLKELFPLFCKSPVFQKKTNALKSVEGHLSGSMLQCDGPFSALHKWKLQAVTSIQDVSFHLQGAGTDPMKIQNGDLKVSPDEISFSALKVSVMDASSSMSGSIREYQGGVNQMKMDISGSVLLHSRSYQWLAGMIHFPQILSPRLPLEISNARLQWQHDRKVVFQGDLKSPAGKVFSVRWEQAPEDERRTVKVILNDQHSQATIEYIFSPEIREFSFNGYLHTSTLDQTLKDNQILKGWIKGNFRVHAVIPQKINVYGNFCGQSVRIPGTMPYSGWIEFFDLKADSNRITLAPTSLKLETMEATLSGNITFLKDQIQMDLSAAASHLDGKALHCLFTHTEKLSSPQNIFSKLMSACPIRGELHLKAKHFQYDTYAWKPLHADIHFENGQTKIEMIVADICGVSMPGRIQIFPHQLSIAIQPSADKQDINHAVACLLNQKDLITGKFDLQGGMEAVADLHHLKNAFVGTLEFKAGDGRIYRLNLLAKILALLNVTELLRGKVPDVIEEGFRYDKLESHVEINNGSVLVLSDGILDAPSMKLIFEGDVDLKQQTIDLTILVAPFQTINFIIEHIPLVGGILGGSLYAIPLRAEGELNDPKIRLLSSSEISSRLIDTMKRTLQIPVELIKPLFDQEPEKNNKQ